LFFIITSFIDFILIIIIIFNFLLSQEKSGYIVGTSVRVYYTNITLSL